RRQAWEAPGKRRLRSAPVGGLFRRTAVATIRESAQKADGSKDSRSPPQLVPGRRKLPPNYWGGCQPRWEQVLYQVIGLSRLVVDGYRWDHDQRRYGEPHRQFRARGPNGGRRPWRAPPELTGRARPLPPTPRPGSLSAWKPPP